jgi:hypothetical protein
LGSGHRHARLGGPNFGIKVDGVETGQHLTFRYKIAGFNRAFGQGSDQRKAKIDLDPRRDSADIDLPMPGLKIDQFGYDRARGGSAHGRLTFRMGGQGT